MRYNRGVRSVIVAMGLVLAGCPAKEPAKPTPKPTSTNPDVSPVAETEPEREAKRLEASHAIVPKGSACLPVGLHKKSGPRLELAAIGNDAILCAYDTTRNRLLGPVACWKIDLASGGLTYREPAPLPAIGFPVRIDDPCVRGFCLPKETPVPSDKVAHMAYNLDGSKVALLTSDQVNLFDTKTRTRDGGFSVKGVGPVSGLYLVADWVFVEAGEEDKRRIYQFKTDGTKLGAITDEKDQSILNGSFSVFDARRVAVSEPGWSALIVIDTETGKKTRIPRTVPKSPCTAAETAGYWAGADDLSEKCNKYMVKTFDHLVGATAVAGARNLLVVLRNGRLGELGVLDAANLAEKKSIGLEWCEAEEVKPTPKKSKASKDSKDSKDSDDSDDE